MSIDAVTPLRRRMPVLRRPHDRHRDFRARMRAQAPAFTTARSNQDRHLMMPSPAIHHYCSNARHSCWLSAGIAQARIGALHSITAVRPILARGAQIARSYRRKRPCFAASRSRQPFQSGLSKPEPAAKSPWSPRHPPPAHLPRFRALALFGRRPV